MTCTCSNGWVVTDQSGYDGTRTQVTRPCEQCRPGLRRALMQARDWVSGGNELIARLYRRGDAKDERIVATETPLRLLADKLPVWRRALQVRRVTEDWPALEAVVNDMAAMEQAVAEALRGAVVESISPERDERRPATIRMRQGDRR